MCCTCDALPWCDVFKIWSVWLNYHQWDAKKKQFCVEMFEGASAWLLLSGEWFDPMTYVTVGIYYWEICFFDFDFSGQQGSEEGNHTDLVNQWWLSCCAMALDCSSKNQELWLLPNCHCSFSHAILLGILLVREQFRTNMNQHHQYPGDYILPPKPSRDWYETWAADSTSQADIWYGKNISSSEVSIGSSGTATLWIIISSDQIEIQPTTVVERMCLV